ncbi:MAG: translocation/assembly module TamB domain-containing protein [Pelobacteraceae bacterium]
MAGYNTGIWKGAINNLAGSDRNGPWHMTAPTPFSVSAERISLSPLVITAGLSEHLKVAADVTLNPLIGTIRAQWAGLNLARANQYLQDAQLSGSSHGSATIGFLPDKRLTISGNAAASGTFTGQGHSMTVKRSEVAFDGSEQGLKIGVELGTADGGRLKGTFSSPEPFRLVVPEKGKLTAELSGIDLALFKPWLPLVTVLEGRISGRAHGTMLPGQHFELDGTASLSEGALHQSLTDGELNLTFTSATASWGWRGEALSGALSLTMADHGQVRANFQLPVPARLPVAVDPKGPLKASLIGKLQEKGIISSLFPGLVQESFGNLDAELAVTGSWELPQVGGTLRLGKAGAYLPSAGIRLTDVQLAAHLEKNLIFIDSYKALSGPGHIEGTAQVTLAGWKVLSYRGTVLGDNFQTVHLPELQIFSTPKLSFEGTPQKVTVRGELHLPELRIAGSPSRTAVAPSSDVIREGRVIPLAASSPLVLDVQVQVILGEQVFVKVAGIDAQLGGAVNLSCTSLDRITSKGEIKVIKGRYRTYGVNLDIARGRLFFAGGPIDQPSLDVLALRTIGNVRAGVTVAGTLQRPVTKLYSEPAMPDVDILAYIVLGHPLGSSGEQASLVNQAAGALLTSGQAEVLQNQIKSHLGLSTLEIQGDVGKTNGSMGYKPLQVTAPGSIPTMQQPGITETMLTVGKYLTPKLYISYGRSLFTGSNLFLLRYDIFRQWQIETQTSAPR